LSTMAFVTPIGEPTSKTAQPASRSMPHITSRTISSSSITSTRGCVDTINHLTGFGRSCK
jgi:hypothetical protein